MTVSRSIQELSAAEVQQKLGDRSIVLIDVREPHEFLAERIPGALLFPLSTFDPGALSALEGREVIFHCGTGKRSATAIGQCLEQGIGHAAHLAGGIQAWKAAGLPTTTPRTLCGGGAR